MRKPTTPPEIPHYLRVTSFWNEETENWKLRGTGTTDITCDSRTGPEAARHRNRSIISIGRLTNPIDDIIGWKKALVDGSYIEYMRLPLDRR